MGQLITPDTCVTHPCPSQEGMPTPDTLSNGSPTSAQQHYYR